MRNNNKNKRKTPSPHLSLFRRINFIPSFLYLLPQQCRWMGNKGWHQFVKCCLCCWLLKVRALHTPLLIHCGVFHGVQVDLCSSMDLQSLEDHILHHHGLHHELQGNLCSGTWTTSSYPFSPTLVSAVLFFCSPIVSLPAAAALFEKKSVVQGKLPLSLMPWPVAGPSWGWLELSSWDIGQLLEEATPAAPHSSPPLPSASKTWLCKTHTL